MARHKAAIKRRKKIPVRLNPKGPLGKLRARRDAIESGKVPQGNVVKVALAKQQRPRAKAKKTPKKKINLAGKIGSPRKKLTMR